MTILNFPASPSNGDIYVANGISYVYNDNAWTSNSEESNNEIFVNVIGDNMTGNLTLGGDKISLNATTGVGLFSGDVKIGGTTAAPNIALNADGTATFTGKVATSTYFSADRTNANVAVFEGQLNSTQTSLVRADGSADFAQRIVVGGDLNLSPSDSVFIAYDNTGGGSTTQLFARGDARFGIGVGSFGTDADGVYIEGSTGTVIVTKNDTATTGTDLNVWRSGRFDLGETITMNADGSASFAGLVSTDVGFDVNRRDEASHTSAGRVYGLLNSVPAEGITQNGAVVIQASRGGGRK